MNGRRDFLKQAGCLTCVGLGMAGTTWGSSRLSSPSAASLRSRANYGEPVERQGAAKFKYSLAAYSYRSLLQDPQANFGLLDFIDDCIALGLDGTELTSYYFPESFGGEYLRQLKRYCFRNGLGISGTAVRNDFGLPAGDARQENMAHVKQWVDYAAEMGAPVIRIFAGHQPQGQSAEETHRLIVEGIEECCAYAGERGVHLALENHGGPTATAAGLLSLVRDVQSPWFGVNLDSGNFHSEDVYAELAEVAPYAVNVQVKVVVSGPDRVKHPTDFTRLAKILADVGYRGYIVLEYEEGGDPRAACREYLPQLRDACEAVLATS